MSDSVLHHIQHVTLPPHLDRSSPDDLSRLLDSLDVFERDRMLTGMHLAFLRSHCNVGCGRDKGRKA